MIEARVQHMVLGSKHWYLKFVKKIDKGRSYILLWFCNQWRSIAGWWWILLDDEIIVLSYIVFWYNERTGVCNLWSATWFQLDDWSWLHVLILVEELVFVAGLRKNSLLGMNLERSCSSSGTQWRYFCLWHCIRGMLVNGNRVICMLEIFPKHVLGMSWTVNIYGVSPQLFCLYSLILNIFAGVASLLPKKIIKKNLWFLLLFFLDQGSINWGFS